MSKRRSFSADGKRRARKALWKKSGGLCFYCGVEMQNTSKISDTQMTLDHLIPLKDGGDNRQANLVAACRKCNQKRGSQSIAKFAGVYKEVQPTNEICGCTMPYIKRETREIYRCVLCKKISILEIES